MAVPSFSMRVLAGLRAGGYRPRAWGAMLALSWQQSRDTAQAHPHMVRSWRWLVGGSSAATALMLAVTARRHGGAAALRSAVPLVVATAAQAGDIYVHLGLHRNADGQHYANLGAANMLTALRGWVAAWISSRLMSHTPLTDDELLLALVLICATDVADGRVARSLAQTSPLGRYLDAEADVTAWLALTIAQIRCGQVPPWFLWVYALRWGAPMAVGFVRTFAEADPMPLAPSQIARASGVVHVAMAITALVAARRAQRRDAAWWQRSRDALLATTCALLGAATVAQAARLLRHRSNIA